MDKGMNLPVGNAPLEHPKPAIGMNVLDAAFSQDLFRLFDIPRDFIRALDPVVFDVDDAQTDAQAFRQFLQTRGLFDAPSFEFEDQMVGPKL